MNQLFPSAHFEDLDKKGFLVIPSFLSSDEVECLLEDFNSQGAVDNANYSLVEVRDSIIQMLKPKLTSALEQVDQNTQVKVDMAAVHMGLYFESDKINFGWHQDHESYYALQNHYDYLNFFIPIQKPEKAKGNLQVVPWDRFEDLYPEAYSKLIRSGANNTSRVNGKTIFTEDQGLTTELPIDVGEIAFTPELGAGDLLLFRGDIVHQTQDADTDRIAFSIRFTNPDTVVSRKELVTGGPRKTYMMINNWSYFGPLIKAFALTGQKTMTWTQLQEEIKKIELPKTGFKTKGKIIHLYLWLQRLATRSVLQSIRCWSGSKAANTYIESQKQGESC